MEKKKTRLTKHYDNKHYGDYTRIVKLKNGSVYFKYVFKYSHFEPTNTPHIKDPNKPEYTRKTKNGLHVYYEDVDQRERVILDESKIQKAGRKVGSKDSKQRIRTCQKKIK